MQSRGVCRNAKLSFDDRAREVALHMSAKPVFQTEPFGVGSVVHLFKAVVALVVTPIDKNGSMIDAGAILAPSFETDMVGW